MEKTYFDGRAFEDLGITVERVHDPIPEMREELEARPNGHGSFLNSLTMSPREITLECRYFGDRWQDFDDMMDELAAWLVTDGDREMVLRTNPDQHYMAHYRSYSEGDREGGTGIGAFELSFCASDPLRYGERRSMVVTSFARVDVGGTDLPDMTISVQGARVGNSSLFGMRFVGPDGVERTLRVPLPDSAAHAVSLDCVGHVATVDGRVSGVTLSSDWPDFAPGRWKAYVAEGTGTATLSWTQRYR